jgi:hypothetical protein
LVKYVAKLGIYGNNMFHVEHIIDSKVDWLPLTYNGIT